MCAVVSFVCFVLCVSAGEVRVTTRQRKTAAVKKKEAEIAGEEIPDDDDADRVSA